MATSKPAAGFSGDDLIDLTSDLAESEHEYMSLDYFEQLRDQGTSGSADSEHKYKSLDYFEPLPDQGTSGSADSEHKYKSLDYFEPLPDQGTSGSADSEHKYKSLDYFDPLCNQGGGEFDPLCNQGGGEFDPLSNQGGGEFDPLCNQGGGEFDPLSTQGGGEFDPLSNQGGGEFDPLSNQGGGESDNLVESGPACTFEDAFTTLEELMEQRPEESEQENIVHSKDTSQSNGAEAAAGIADRGTMSLPASRRTQQALNYEQLQSRTFADRESDAFCEMVAEVKRQYTHEDVKTNLGYVLSPVHDSSLPILDRKVVVHLPGNRDPMVFTCETSSLVAAVINHALARTPELQGEEMLLKIHGRAEYLDNALPLAKFDYVHHCLMMDKDIVLEMVPARDAIRPFLRTVKDDGQVMYIPRENISMHGEAVSKASLDSLLDKFYKEVDKVADLASKDAMNRDKLLTFRQSVKDIWTKLANIETIGISDALNHLQDMVEELNKHERTARQITGEKSVSTDPATVDTIKKALRSSQLQDVQKGVDRVVTAVQQLVHMYCHTFHTDFCLASAIHSPPGEKDVSGINDKFKVHIATAHHLTNDKCEEFKVVCSLNYGIDRLQGDKVTRTVRLRFCSRVVWDEWLTFDVPLSKLPRETRLCMMLVGTKDNTTETIGSASMQLYSQKGHLLQGSRLVPVTMGMAVHPTMPSSTPLLPGSVLLQVNLPECERTIRFASVSSTVLQQGQALDNLPQETQTQIIEILEKDSSVQLKDEELAILWQHRYYLCDRPTALPRLLQVKERDGWGWCRPAHLADPAWLSMWSPLPMAQALELLLPRYPDLDVRELAVKSLARLPSDELVHYLPQLIQALKFEGYHSSPLARLLLETSCKSVRFAHQFFWLLRGLGGQANRYKRRYELMMFVGLASVAGDGLYQEFRKQEELVKVMARVAMHVKESKDKDKDDTLKAGIQDLCKCMKGKDRLLLPCDPGLEVSGIEVKSCSYFTSNTFPLKLVFSNSDLKAQPVPVIFKVGDDLSQDMLTEQMIRIMNMLWLREGLDLKMVTYSCLATGPREGIIELVTEVETLHKIQKSASGVTGCFNPNVIKNWLQKHNPTENDYKRAMENFTMSCAGYCVVTYVLGIGDRHNDNIMLKKLGNLFHIDFCKFLGEAQKFAGIKRDRVPFVLTPDMVHVITDDGEHGKRFQQFVDLCCQAFNILRKHFSLFRALFMMMSLSGMKRLTEQEVHYIKNALLPGHTKAQASAAFAQKIEESRKSLSSSLNFFAHNVAHARSSSSSGGAGLSFAPNTYTLETEGRITSTRICQLQKRYQPERHYVYIVKVKREKQKDPAYVYRKYEHFVELRDKLVLKYPMIKWPELSRTVVGRSSIRKVAEGRKEQIDDFLKELWSTEIVECDLMYTFFHSTLSDEQEALADETNINVSKLKDSTQTPATAAPFRRSRQVPGWIQLSIQYRKNVLEVLVMHVKDLNPTANFPSPFVTLHLRPGSVGQSKKKTRTVENKVHPTFYEVFEFRLKDSHIQHRTLEVTVCDGNKLFRNFLGAVHVDLDLDPGLDLTKWYPLEQS